MDEGQRTVLCVAKPYAIQKQIHLNIGGRLIDCKDESNSVDT